MYTCQAAHSFIHSFFLSCYRVGRCIHARASHTGPVGHYVTPDGAVVQGFKPGGGCASARDYSLRYLDVGHCRRGVMR